MVYSTTQIIKKVNISTMLLILFTLLIVITGITLLLGWFIGGWFYKSSTSPPSTPTYICSGTNNKSCIVDVTGKSKLSWIECENKCKSPASSSPSSISTGQNYSCDKTTGTCTITNSNDQQSDWFSCSLNCTKRAGPTQLYKPNIGKNPCNLGSYLESSTAGGVCKSCPNGFFCPDGFNSYPAPINTIPSFDKTGIKFCTSIRGTDKPVAGGADAQLDNTGRPNAVATDNNGHVTNAGAVQCKPIPGCAQADPYHQKCMD